MKIFLMICLLLAVSACFHSGDFTPERHAIHDMGRPDCAKTPERCVDGYPW